MFKRCSTLNVYGMDVLVDHYLLRTSIIMPHCISTTVTRTERPLAEEVRIGYMNHFIYQHLVCLVPFGSGLNTLSSYDWIQFDRIKWDVCSNASENDCLTPKGFTFMRWRVAEGVIFDVINLHTDAGTEDGDEKARTANVQQVADFVSANSAGNPVLIFGDTNSRYTRSLDNIPKIISQNGLKDAWVQLARNGVAPAAGADAILCPDGVPTTINCEVVDKVL